MAIVFDLSGIAAIRSLRNKKGGLEMPRHPVRLDIGSIAKLAFVALCLLGGGVSANDAVPDIDPAGVTDPVERRFYQDLRALRDRQRMQRQELVDPDLPPAVRLEKRRVMLIQSHEELQRLEADYQSKLTPEARSRWMDRKANRQKRFDRLQDKPESESGSDADAQRRKPSRKKSY